MAYDPSLLGMTHGRASPPVEARERSYKEWLDAPVDEKVVLIIDSAVVETGIMVAFNPEEEDGKLKKEAVIPGLLDGITAKVGHENLCVVFDEATAFKSDNTKTWEAVRFLATQSQQARLRTDSDPAQEPPV